MRVFLAGGTGLVGQRLVARLLQRGDQVVVLTRRAEAARMLWGNRVEVAAGDPMQEGSWMNAVASCGGVVNLVGEGIFKRRWSASFKELLKTSRVQSTANIVKALAQNTAPSNGQPRVLVNASAIGYYGPTGNEELTESSPPGDDMLARLCVDWEKAAESAAAHGLRVAIVRVGVVLDKAGGALQKMLLPFKMFAGGPVGSGRQYVSWIHHDDLAGILLLALDDIRATGPFNGTAPQPVTNKEFSTALGRALHRPSFLPTPALALRVALGEVANIITKGQRVLPKRALELGYKFRFEKIDEALTEIFAGG